MRPLLCTPLFGARRVDRDFDQAAGLAAFHQTLEEPRDMRRFAARRDPHR
jgi:hypothetical protein